MKRLLLSSLLILAAALSIAGVTVSPVSAACAAGDNSAKGQVLQGIGESGGDCSGAGVTSVTATIVNILSMIVGIAAVIMVIIAGFKYVTSGGDSNSVGSAKNTLVYALVGLAIVALAQVLVHFVFNAATGTTTACPYTITDNKGVVVKNLTAGDPQCAKP